MTTTPAYAGHGPLGWLRYAEHRLDGWGKGAWIAAMVAGFILFWPIGLALLAYMIWGKRMFGRHCRYGHNPARRGVDRFTSSGNAAFDAYKAETLRRLEEEQQAFEGFLQRLRDARDKQEFDMFMDERARSAEASTDARLAPDAGERAETPDRDH